MGKSRWPSWAPVPKKPTVSVDVKQHSANQAKRLVKTTTTKNMIRSKINLLRSFYIDFIRGCFWNNFTDTSFMSSKPPLMHSFPAHHFDVTKMSLTSRIEHQEVLFCVQVMEEKHVDINHFCHRLFLSQ